MQKDGKKEAIYGQENEELRSTRCPLRIGDSWAYAFETSDRLAGLLIEQTRLETRIIEAEVVTSDSVVIQMEERRYDGNANLLWGFPDTIRYLWGGRGLQVDTLQSIVISNSQAFRSLNWPEIPIFQVGNEKCGSGSDTVSCQYSVTQTWIGPACSGHCSRGGKRETTEQSLFEESGVVLFDWIFDDVPMSSRLISRTMISKNGILVPKARLL